jgi:hypothetical protein
MSGAQIVAEQESATRPTSRIDSESWDGVAQVGRIEKDVARHLDRRVVFPARTVTPLSVALPQVLRSGPFA